VSDGGGTLHVVATPIGNLEDVSARALRVLGEANLLLAEDTRRTRILLDRHGIAARPLSLHAHNEAGRIDRVLEALAAGDSVALVSDAGTPLVSDPGERLVAAAIAAGHPVTPIPGASAVTAALSVSGFSAVPFTFLGFLPRKASARRALLGRFRDAPETLVLFESPHRLSASLRHLAEALGDRPACVTRELTKLHEETLRGTLIELAERFAEGARGEISLVIRGAEATDAPRVSDADLDARIREAQTAGESSRELAARLAAESGESRRSIYNRAVALRRESKPES
jgi:16S rRNA (cytidine1402-2'-O)-methyltransferase